MTERNDDLDLIVAMRKLFPAGSINVRLKVVDKVFPDSKIIKNPNTVFPIPRPRNEEHGTHLAPDGYNGEIICEETRNALVECACRYVWSANGEAGFVFLENVCKNKHYYYEIEIVYDE